MITPTVGRIVLVKNRHANEDRSQPEGAQVCFVHNDRSINVGGFDMYGMPFAMHNLTLVQEEDDEPEDGPYAEWMPYQKAVAKGEIPPTLHATPEKKSEDNADSIF